MLLCCLAQPDTMSHHTCVMTGELFALKCSFKLAFAQVAQSTLDDKQNNSNRDVCKLVLAAQLSMSCLTTKHLGMLSKEGMQCWDQDDTCQGCMQLKRKWQLVWIGSNETAAL